MPRGGEQQSRRGLRRGPEHLPLEALDVLHEDPHLLPVESRRRIEKLAGESPQDGKARGVASHAANPNAISGSAASLEIRGRAIIPVVTVESTRR